MNSIWTLGVCKQGPPQKETGEVMCFFKSILAWGLRGPQLNLGFWDVSTQLRLEGKRKSTQVKKGENLIVLKSGNNMIKGGET